MRRPWLVLGILATVWLAGRYPTFGNDQEWNTEPTLWPIPVADPTLTVTAMTLNRDDQWLAVGLSSGDLLLLNAADGSLIRRWPAHDLRINAVQFLGQKESLASGGDDGIVRLWQTADGTEIESWPAQKWITSLSSNSSGRFLATGTAKGQISVRDLQTKPTDPEVFTLESGVKALAFSPEGTQLLAGGAGRIGVGWSMSSKKPTIELKGHGGAIRAVAYSPDGLQIATASEDGTARLWDAKAGERGRALTGHAGMVWCVAYSADGVSLATGGIDQTVRLWNPKSGERRAIFRGPTTPVLSVNFSQDGSQLFVASQERTIRRYQRGSESAKD